MADKSDDKISEAAEKAMSSIKPGECKFCLQWDIIGSWILYINIINALYCQKNWYKLITVKPVQYNHHGREGGLSMELAALERVKWTV